MRNFFEQELWHLFGDGRTINSPYCSGQNCYGTLDRELRVRIQFISSHISGEYDALKLTVLNRTSGPVDTQILKLGDLLGRKPVPGNPNFREGVAPHIWDNYGNLEWYAYRPSEVDYETIRQAVGQYLDVFRERTPERSHTGPKLVYICAPLRGDVEKNIEFARQKAQEVFLPGDVPVCPHLMFPPIADPDDPVQDQAAREMGLRLVEACQQVNVYGPARTEGMRVEIRHANGLGILVKAGGEMGERTRRHRDAASKQKKEEARSR